MQQSHPNFVSDPRVARDDCLDTALISPNDGVQDSGPHRCLRDPNSGLLNDIEEGPEIFKDSLKTFDRRMRVRHRGLERSIHFSFNQQEVSRRRFCCESNDAARQKIFQIDVYDNYYFYNQWF